MKPQLEYSNAHVYLPGSVDQRELEKPISSYGNMVRFSWNGCLVEGHAELGIFSNATLAGQFVQPLAELITKDLKTIEDLIPKLTELAKDRKAADILVYRRENGIYDVVDNQSTPPGRVFPILKEIQRTDIRLLDPQYHKFVQLSKVHQVGSLLESVHDADLRGALERAIIIYEKADELRAIMNKTVKP